MQLSAPFLVFGLVFNIGLGILATGITTMESRKLERDIALAPGQVIRVDLAGPAGKTLTEEWEVKIDFLGNRFIENGGGDRLLYAASNDWFAALDG